MNRSPASEMPKNSNSYSLKIIGEPNYKKLSDSFFDELLKCMEQEITTENDDPP